MRVDRARLLHHIVVPTCVLLFASAISTGGAAAAQKPQPNRSGGARRCLDLGAAPAQSKPGPKPFGMLDTLADRSRTAELSTVKMLIDYGLGQTVLGNVPPSVRGRLVQADVDFRRGTGPGVSEPTLVSAYNDAVSLFASAPNMRTSLAQVRIVRAELKRALPHLGDTNDSERDCTDPMTPAEAAFVLGFVLTQKLVNPEYQLAPDEWARREEGRLQHALDARTQAAVNHAIARHPVPTPFRGLASALLNDPMVESGPKSIVAHHVLDELGIRR